MKYDITEEQQTKLREYERAFRSALSDSVNGFADTCKDAQIPFSFYYTTITMELLQGLAVMIAHTSHIAPGEAGFMLACLIEDARRKPEGATSH